MDQHRPELIRNARNIDPILDDLLADGVITEEALNTVMSKTTPQEKMRKLYYFLKSRRAKDCFYSALEEHEEHLLEEL